jgi:hypothetical protein
MKIIYRRCAGLDVHEKSVFVCARILRGKQLEVVEATFHWRPVWNVLDKAASSI